MFKLLYNRFQQYVNWKIPVVHAGVWRGRGTRDQSNSIRSLQFSRSVMLDPLRPHELQHTRPSCPSRTPGVYSTLVHWVGDAIQPSHPLSSPSPPAFNLFHHQGLFQWIGSSHQVAKVLELQHQSFQQIFRVGFMTSDAIKQNFSKIF